jgi:hypothetical protein
MAWLFGEGRHGLAFECITLLQSSAMRETKDTYQKMYYQKDPIKDFLYKDDSRLLDEERYQYNQYIPAANRLLAAAAKGTWIVMKEVARIAVRMPHWFARVNTPRPNDRGARANKSATRPN